MYWKGATSRVGLDSRMDGRKVRKDSLEEARVKRKCSGGRRCGELSPYLVKIIRSHFLPGGVYREEREGVRGREGCKREGVEERRVIELGEWEGGREVLEGVNRSLDWVVGNEGGDEDVLRCVLHIIE